MSYRNHLVPNDITPSEIYKATVVDFDTISRRAVLDIALKYCPDDDGTCSEAGSDLRNMLDEIEALPPAEPERIKSKWALHTYMPHNKFCLACRNDSPYNKRWDFCPKCGADMRGEQDGRDS